MTTDFDYSAIDVILDETGRSKSSIIAVLQEIQGKYNYLPHEIFEHLSKELGLSKTQILSVVTFYENFSLEPKGKYIIRICDGTACHVRKSIPILEELKKQIALPQGKKTTEDMLFTLETVACLGACGLAPVLTVNDVVHPSMTPEKAKELIESIKEAEKNAGE